MNGLQVFRQDNEWVFVVHLVGWKRGKLGRDVQHWAISSTWNYHINRSMPGVSAEWEKDTRRLVGGDIGRVEDRGRGHGCHSWWPCQAIAPLSSFRCCGKGFRSLIYAMIRLVLEGLFLIVGNEHKSYRSLSLLVDWYLFHMYRFQCLVWWTLFLTLDWMMKWLLVWLQKVATVLLMTLTGVSLICLEML